MATSSPTSPSQTNSGADGNASTPQSSLTSPDSSKFRDKEKEKEKDEKRRKSISPGDDNTGEEEEQVEALSEMMCSLVTNQSGETRYFGSCPSRACSIYIAP